MSVTILTIGELCCGHPWSMCDEGLGAGEKILALLPGRFQVWLVSSGHHGEEAANCTRPCCPGLVLRQV